VLSTLGPDVKRPPSDFELLRAIYERHRAEFTEPGLTATKTGVMIAIDVEAVAADLGTDADTVWGRLYNHLDRLYGEERRSASPRRALFMPSEALAAAEPAVICGLGLISLGGDRARRAHRVHRDGVDEHPNVSTSRVALRVHSRTLAQLTAPTPDTLPTCARDLRPRS